MGFDYKYINEAGEAEWYILTCIIELNQYGNMNNEITDNCRSR